MGPVSLDLVMPFVASDPASEIGFLAYTALIVTSLLIIRHSAYRDSRPEKETIAETVIQP